MKRLISVFLALVLLLSSGALAYMDPATGSSEHTHHWVGNDQGRPATCTESGVKYEYCDICWQTRERTIPPLGHQFSKPWQTYVEPTCTEPGKEVNYCQRINYGYKCNYEWRRDIPALGHDWSDWYVLKEPTPEEPGIEERKCQRCGITEQRPLYAEGGEPELKLSVTIADEQPTYFDGESIHYTYELTNTSNVTLYVDYVYYYENDGSNGVDGWNLFPDPLEPGKSVYYYGHTHTVTKSDIDQFAPWYQETFKAYGYADPGKKTGEVESEKVAVKAHIGELTEEEKGELTLIKSVANEPANGAFFTEGEEIQFTVTVQNSGNAPLYKVEVIEYPSGWTGWETDYYTLGTFEKLGPGEKASYSVTYTVKDVDCYASSYTNQVQAIGWSQPEAEGDYDAHAYAEATAEAGYDDEDIGDMEMWIEKTETSTPANGSYYVEGEEITYKISVWNCQSYPLYNVEIWDTSPTDADVLLGKFAEYGPHQVNDYVYTYKVTAEDCADGVHVNSAYVLWQSSLEPDEESEANEPNYFPTEDVESPCGKADGVVITKKVISTPKNGLYYTEGEEIQYEIRLDNYTGSPLHDFWLHDTMVPDEKLNPPTGLGDMTSFVSATYSYKVTAEDVLAGSVINTAFAEWFDDDREPHSKYSETLITPTGDGGDEEGVVLHKRVVSTPANGLYYVEGETVIYEIKLENNGDKTIYYVEIIDPIKGDGEDATLDSVSEIEPGESKSYLIHYKVTAQDVQDSVILNQARAEFTYDMEEPTTVYSEIVVVGTGGEIQEVVPSVYLVKSEASAPANGSYYVEGEPVTYSLYIWNDNEFDIYNASIYDDLYDEDWNQSIGYYPLIKAGETTSSVSFSYTVTDKDVANGGILNQAAVEFFVEIGDEDYTSWSNEVYVPTGADEAPAINLSVTKSVLNPPANGIAYVENEVISYLITFVNSSDYEISINSMPDTTFNHLSTSTQDLGAQTVSAHESLPLTISHTVSAQDVAAGYVTNLIEVNAMCYEMGDGYQAFYLSDQVTVETMQGRIEKTREYPFASKVVTSTPKNGSYYVEGEKIEYDLILVNPTGRTFNNVNAYDILSDAPGYYLTSAPALGTEVLKFHVSYTVGKLDAVLESVYNIGWFTMDDPDYGDSFTIYTNEVTVPTKKTGSTGGTGRTVCEYRLVGSGSGVHSFSCAYCTEHAGVQAAASKLVNSATNDLQLIKAYEVALGLWQQALDREYARLAQEAEGELKTALQNDQTVFNTYLAALRESLTAQGVNEAEIDERLINTLRDRVCELCYTAGTAPEARKDLQSADAKQMERISAPDCTYAFDTSKAPFFAKTLSVCDRHAVLVGVVERTLNAANDETRALAWEKAKALWQTEMNGKFDALIKEAEPQAKHVLIVERAAFLAQVSARAALYDAYYPDGSPAAEIALRMVMEKAMSLCK